MYLKCHVNKTNFKKESRSGLGIVLKKIVTLQLIGNEKITCSGIST